MLQRRRPADSAIERQILTAMIVSDQFLTEIQAIWTDDALQTPFTIQIAKWCNAYFEEYKSAPKKYIQDLFATHRDNIAPESADLIKDFLVSISDEYEQTDTLNVDYLAKKAENYFRLSNLRDLKSKIDQSLVAQDADSAESSIAAFRRISRDQTRGIDIIEDTEAVKQAFTNTEKKVLIKLPGALGYATGPIKRGNLFSIVAASGVGKTWWLMYIAILAWLRGFKVLFVSLEMDEEEMMLRFYKWLTGLPDERSIVKIPFFDCQKNIDDSCKLAHRSKINFKRTDSLETSKESVNPYATMCHACKQLKSGLTSDFEIGINYYNSKRNGIDLHAVMTKRSAIASGSSKRGKIILKQFASGTVDMQQFRTHLDNMAYYDGFEADLIITDYGDKFKRTERDYRHGINQIWEDHKSIAQDKSIGVVSGSQSNTARTGKKIKQGNWGESIRKLELSDAGFAVNQTPAEALQNYYRCNVLKRRHGKQDLMSEIIVLNQLEIGRPYIDSMKMDFFQKEANNDISD